MDVALLPGERLDRLFSQNIEIIQSAEVFSFSLDAVLLADFAQMPRQGKVVDLCAGNGAVSLFISQKTKSQIMGIEIQPRLADMARRSIAHNGLAEQIEILTADLATSTEFIAKDSVDVITCNPPYFKVTAASRKNPNDYLAIARHELTTNLDQVLQTSFDLLKTNGHFYMVHRPERLLEILEEMQSFQIIPKEIRFVYPKVGRDANMILVKGIKFGKKAGLKVLSPLFVYDETGHYLPEVDGILYGHD